MRMPSPRVLWLAIGLGSAALAAGSLGLTVWQNLHPCHLCIFQRLLLMVMTLSGFAATLPRVDRLAGAFVAPLALAGAGAAGYQSWLQTQPAGSISCVGGDPSLIERLVEWLGQQAPALFLATGFCEDEELVILGLSLANWSLLGFVGFFLAAVWALFATRR